MGLQLHRYALGPASRICLLCVHQYCLCAPTASPALRSLTSFRPHDVMSYRRRSSPAAVAETRGTLPAGQPCTRQSLGYPVVLITAIPFSASVPHWIVLAIRAQCRQV